MAAHLLTALTYLRNQCEGKDITDNTWDTLRSALDLSCWTEDLQLGDYMELENIVTTRNGHQLMMFLDTQIPKAQEEWEKLGRPRTREEWHSAQFQFSVFV